MAYTSAPAPTASPSPTKAPTAATAAPADAIYTQIPTATTRLLDSLVSTPRALWCVSACLRAAYAGALFQVRRASDNQVSAIGCDPATGLADTAALATFCAGTNGFVKIVYDQSGNGYDIQQLATTKQPKIYDSATGPVLNNGVLVMQYDNTDDCLERSDSCGLSGSIAFSTWTVFRTSNASCCWSWTGGTANATAFETIGTDATHTRISIEGSSRTFSASDITAGMNNMICQIAAGAGVGTARMMQNGTQLSESSVFAGATTMNMGTTVTKIIHEATPINNKLGLHAIWNADLSAADVAILNAAEAALYP